MSFFNERMGGEIYSIGKKIDFNNLTYRFKGPNLAPIYFIDFRGPMHIYIMNKKWWCINRKNLTR